MTTWFQEWYTDCCRIYKPGQITIIPKPEYSGNFEGYNTPLESPAYMDWRTGGEWSLKFAQINHNPEVFTSCFLQKYFSEWQSFPKVNDLKTSQKETYKVGP